MLTVVELKLLWSILHTTNKGNHYGPNCVPQNSKTETVATISREKALEIAKTKLVDTNANDEEAVLRMVAGSAKQMGIKIEGVDPVVHKNGKKK